VIIMFRDFGTQLYCTVMIEKSCRVDGCGSPSRF
jgi:hypothetical protein